MLIGIISILFMMSSDNWYVSGSISSYTNVSLSTDEGKTKNVDQTNAEDKLGSKIREFIAEKVLNQSKSSIVIGFIDPKGTVVYNFGNISEANNVPVDSSTIYDLDSLTKTFTTLALADMVNEGIVNLDDPIAKFLPSNISIPTYEGFNITVEDLATHTSGLPFLPPNIWTNKSAGEINSSYTVSDLYDGLSNTSLLSKPGAKFLYSDFGMGLLGQILINIEGNGSTYEQIIKDRVLNILGMNSTKVTLTEKEINDRFPNGHINGSVVFTPKIPESITAAGGLKSTADDMLKYLAANLGLLHTTLDDSFRLQHLIYHPVQMQNPMHYYEYVTLGWGVITNLGIELVNHQGSYLGWNSFIGFIPSEQTGVIILCNCDKSDMNTKSLGLVLLGFSEPNSLTPINTDRNTTHL